MVYTSAGRLRHYVTIEQIDGKSQSTSGATTPNWTQIVQTWAEIKPLKGRNVEASLARTKARALSHEITMRYIDQDISPATTRIRYEDRLFEIFAVDNTLEQNGELVIIANEVAA